MAMIKCPECGKDVSDQAEVCINCGFSIKQYMYKKDLNENGKILYCPRCAAIYCRTRMISGDNYYEAIKNPSCGKCGHKLQEAPEEFGLTPSVYWDNDQLTSEKLKKKLITEYIMKQPEFDEEEYKKSYELEPQSTKSSSHSTPRIGPKCPACGSYDTAKVGVLGRAASVFAFGLASNKIGKNWKCRKCGHTW